MGHSQDLSEAFKRLNRACGSVRNGSHDRIEISQDDATHEWVISIGTNNVRTYTGVSLIDAINNISIFELE